MIVFVFNIYYHIAPIQNDLTELYALCNFVNENYLSNYQQFYNEYIIPITKLNNLNTTYNEKLYGNIKNNELQLLISQFILRREINIISQYLPTKHEQIIFCNLTTKQTKLYTSTLKLYKYNNNNNDKNILTTIQELITICNSTHNDLLNDDIDVMLQYSSKLQFTTDLIQQIKLQNNKLVIASNTLQVLNIIELYCNKSNISYYRLDGSTKNTDRIELITSFNCINNQTTIFLLSCKAGMYIILM